MVNCKFQVPKISPHNFIKSEKISFKKINNVTIFTIEKKIDLKIKHQVKYTPPQVKPVYYKLNYYKLIKHNELIFIQHLK